MRKKVLCFFFLRFLRKLFADLTNMHSNVKQAMCYSVKEVNLADTTDWFCITCHSWSMSSCGVLLRRQSTNSVSLPPLQPTSFPSCVARLRASAGLTEAQGQLGTPLWRMALVKVGLLSGDKRWNPTEAPPALSPKIVTYSNREKRAIREIRIKICSHCIPCVKLWARDVHKIFRK